MRGRPKDMLDIDTHIVNQKTAHFEPEKESGLSRDLAASARGPGAIIQLTLADELVPLARAMAAEDY